jgi:hypothetical protein
MRAEMAWELEKHHSRYHRYNIIELRSNSIFNQPSISI